MQCAFDGCDRPSWQASLCSAHYQQRRRNGVLRPIRVPKMFCDIENCGGRFYASGLCEAHYAQRRRGLPVSPINRKGMAAEMRFWRHVTKGPSCWEWHGAGSRGVHPYGTFGVQGATVRAHRFSWELHAGKIPEGIYVLHRCDNPRCIRPDHLFLGTQADNVADMIAKGRASFGDRILS